MHIKNQRQIFINVSGTKSDFGGFKLLYLFFSQDIFKTISFVESLLQGFQSVLKMVDDIYSCSFHYQCKQL